MTDDQARKPDQESQLDSRPITPPHSGIDPEWRQRIQIAREAREQARKARGDRPITFDTRRLPI
ncbi:MAG: hypothetical protein OXF01_17000 [Gemmatimonadetes bacterium]|nr:hypothetical protein [Gemmatimonadota bacterium]